jgi:NAD(P)-dependent dehydrogenase (short-subunit alcohol dehydrogenase family)
VPDPDKRQTERDLRFTPQDMEAFAAASGDRSPLHLDPDFGRRTAFGQCIAYGGLETIALLGLLPDEVQSGLRSVRSVFPGAVPVGAPCTARVLTRPDRPGRWELQLHGRGKILARVSVSTADEPAGSERDAPETAGDPAPDRSAPTTLAPGLELAGAYAPGPALAGLAARFDAGAVMPALLDGIAWASHVVGMSIPGFDGLCAGVTVLAGPGGPPVRQWLRVRDLDQRTDRMVIEGTLRDETGTARCRGLIECFPFTPTPLPDHLALGPGVPAREPGAVAIIGASRGAGGALALALLAAGYHVHAVYARSEGAAARLRALAGPQAERLTLHRLDAANPTAMARLAGTLTAGLQGLVLCAAPPPLPMTLSADTAGELADYVAASVRLAATPLGALAPLLRPDGAWLLVFSAAAVSEPSRELPQLTAAKAALEGLARAASAAAPGLAVLLARVPKLRTDLVNTPSARLRATPPEAIAHELVELVAGGELEPGVTVLQPSGARLVAR